MKRILIRGPDTVGSFVLATPFFRELRKNLADSYIVLCVKPLVYELAKDCPYVDKILLYDKSKLKNIINLKKEKFDTVFLLSGSFESAMVCLLAGIKERIGYPHDHRSILLTKKIVDEGNKHYVDYILNILEQLNFKVNDKEPQLYLKYNSFSNQYDYIFNDKKPVVGITYSSIADDARKWPKEYVIELSKELVRRGYKVVLLGKTKQEIEIPQEHKDTVFNLVNKTSLIEFINILRNLHTYISVSTGGIHIAAALKIRTIGLYIPGEEIGWSPYSKDSVVIYKQVKCAPCNQHKMKYCKNNVCMQAITPQEVLNLVTP